MSTTLQNLFFKHANFFMINNDEERFTKMYICLALFLEAQALGEEWVNDSSIVCNVEKAVQAHHKKYLFVKLLQEYDKQSLLT